MSAKINLSQQNQASTLPIAAVRAHPMPETPNVKSGEPRVSSFNGVAQNAGSAKSADPTLYNVSVNRMETPMQKFQASYEDRAKAVKQARAAGWDGIDGGMLDYIDHHPQIYRDFTTQAEAEAWVKEAIAADKTLFGCGDVEVLKQPKRRCRYCTCNGWLTVQSFIVDDDGAEERTDLPEECCD